MLLLVNIQVFLAEKFKMLGDAIELIEDEDVTENRENKT